jgi:hypothetical protein
MPDGAEPCVELLSGILRPAVLENEREEFSDHGDTRRGFGGIV